MINRLLTPSNSLATHILRGIVGAVSLGTIPGAQTPRLQGWYNTSMTLAPHFLALQPRHA
jgi:hypothetical protein